MSARILVIDDEPAIRGSLTKFLRDRKGHHVDAAVDGVEAWERLEGADYDLVLTDLVMPRMNGLELIERARAELPEVPIIVLSGRAVFRDVVDAMRAGAYDFIAKPVEDLEELAAVVDRALERRRLVAENENLRVTNLALQEALGTAAPADEIVGESREFRRALKDAEVVAPTDSTVLVRGETGTGKELVARLVHRLSPRRDQPLVIVNCAAIPATLIESELFGHEKGAFTGAIQRKRGRFELAHAGTIFLDEVGDIPLETQVKLLRVLQEQAFERVGGGQTLQVNVRLIAATNRDLEAMVHQKAFRADLFYRLNVFPITLPPLRQRVEDIPPLALHFARKHAARMRRQLKGIAPEALERLQAYPWPGNVRELENIIERAVILCRDGWLRVDAKSLPAGDTGAAAGEGAAPSEEGLQTLAEWERRYILRVLVHTGNVIEGERGAARILGLHPSTLRHRMMRLGIPRST
jgi:DNA-binding NtrC family response regulator